MPVASEKSGGSLQQPPQGVHPARCIQVIDLGTQEDTFGPKAKPRIVRKVRIGWELVDQKATFNEEKGEESFMIGQDYTLSLGAKANLRHMLESWRGQAFTADELKGFELSVLLRKACMLNVIHRKSETTKNVYSTVASVMPVPKGITVAKPTLDCAVYNIEDGENDVYQALPEWIQEKIDASLEARGIAPDSPPETPPAEGGAEDPDEIPF